MQRNYNSVSGVVFLTIVLLTAGCGLHGRPADGALPYAEGGPVMEDPGQDLTARYVDQTGGSDTADGAGPATAWQTLDKAAAALATLPPGAHLLFKRGGAWEGDPTFDKIHGSEGQRIVLGAYGPVDAPRPRITGRILFSNCSYIMFRDLDLYGKMVFRDGTHHSVVYNNILHGRLHHKDSNVMLISNRSHHNALVGNLVYDAGANDLLVIHSNEDGDPGPSHWIIDNVAVGNDGMENGIDFNYHIAATNAHDRPGSGYDRTDIKIIGNRVQTNSVPGLSQRTGRGNAPIACGHEERYVWIIGNTLSGGGGEGIRMGSHDGVDHYQYVQVSGNVIWNVRKQPHSFSCSDGQFFHNTYISSSEDRAVLSIQENARRNALTDNLFMSETGNWMDITGVEPLTAIHAMDRNWYSAGPDGMPEVHFNGGSFDGWKKETGFCANSGLGPVPGVSKPGEAWNDPRTWDQREFLAHFIPVAAFEGNRGNATPGAFDREGNRLGVVMQPFPGLDDNNGYGWEGPLIVQRRYPLPGGGGE